MSDGSADFGAVFAQLAASGKRERLIHLGGVDVRMVRVAGGGEGRWDSHADGPETALVWSGDFTVTFRDHHVALSSGQCCVVPTGADHHGTSRDGAEVVLFRTRSASA